MLCFHRFNFELIHLKGDNMYSKVANIKSMLIAVLVISALFVGEGYTANNDVIKVTHYEFGQIVINEKEYTQDIAIWPNGDIKPGPEDMHYLSMSDFKELLSSDLKKLVVGTGDEGKIELDFGKKLEKKLNEKGIEVIMMTTHELAKFLNEKEERDFLVLAHLNC